MGHEKKVLEEKAPLMTYKQKGYMGIPVLFINTSQIEKKKVCLYHEVCLHCLDWDS